MVDTNRLLGQTINDRYRVLEHIGSGGSGNVYKASNVDTGQMVALKILKGMETETPEAVIRFEKEIAAGARLANPHMVDVHEFGRTREGYLFIAMEFLTGVTLTSILGQSGRMTARRAVHIVTQALDALAEAHKVGIIHRDLKPDNIFILNGKDDGDFVKVLDFGIAKFLQEDKVSTTLSRDGFIFGTPLYISPEQALGWKVGPGSDIYSLGVVLFELLAGSPPFSAETPIGLGMKHVYEPPPLERLCALDETQAGVKKILALMMEKRPERRPASAENVASMFAHLGLVSDRTFDVTGGAPIQKGETSSDAITVKTRPASDALNPIPTESPMQERNGRDAAPGERTIELDEEVVREDTSDERPIEVTADLASRAEPAADALSELAGDEEFTEQTGDLSQAGESKSKKRKRRRKRGKGGQQGQQAQQQPGGGQAQAGEGQKAASQGPVQATRPAVEEPRTPVAGPTAPSDRQAPPPPMTAQPPAPSPPPRVVVAPPPPPPRMEPSRRSQDVKADDPAGRLKSLAQRKSATSDFRFDTGAVRADYSFDDEPDWGETAEGAGQARIPWFLWILLLFGLVVVAFAAYAVLFKDPEPRTRGRSEIPQQRIELICKADRGR